MAVLEFSNVRPFSISSRDLGAAWFELIDCILKHGRVWTIDNGSYEGQQRLEFDYAEIQIRHPGSRPLFPEIPSHMNIPPPCDDEYLNKYLPYLMTNEPPKENELYTYGERIAPQMEKIIERYKRNGFGSNQECIAVARPEDIDLKDPPCLRSIDCRIFPTNALRYNEQQALHFFVYFRSWDLFNGFPINMAAIRMMQEYMAESIGVEAGEIIANSKGLHLYDHVWDIARALVGRPDSITKYKITGRNT
jgi:thymidylate synthase